MTPIITAVIVVTAIGIICAIILSVASKVMYVHEDERISLARECLPGANCGACGFAGCDGYAKALVEDESLSVSLCTPGGADAASGLAEVLGRTAGEVARKVVAVNCCGDCDVTEDKMDYRGVDTCAGAKLFFGGKGKCPYGCLGLGDCVKICPESALYLENGLVHVKPRLCTGCGICTRACPNNLLETIPVEYKVMVACSNHDKGAVTRKACTNGCIACKMCEKTCEQGAFTVIDNLAVIDYEKCTGCGACVEVCKPGCIILRPTLV